MNLYKIKDSSNASSYPRTLYSIIVSVGLLAMFVTFASWVLLSYPISTAVRNYFYGVNGIGDMNSPASWQITMPSEVNTTEKPIVDLPQWKGKDGVDADREDENKKNTEEKTSEIRNNEKVTPGINWQNTTPSEANNGENSTAVISETDPGKDSAPASETLDVQKSNDSGGLGANQEDEENKKVKGNPSEASSNENTTQGVNINNENTTQGVNINNENTTQGVEISQDLHRMKDAPAVDMNQDNKDKQMANDGKSDQLISEDTPKKDTTDNNPSPPLQGDCDLFHGEWFYDESGPLYTNNSCPIITQMQNCQGNGRPDKGYENWRWRPSHCQLPRFDPNKFLELMSGKTLAFVGDSVARNQMESLLCILWQVEVPKNRGNRHMQRWFFRSKSVMIVRIWSSWLVHQTGAPFKDIPEGVAKVFLDVPDEAFMEHVSEFNVVVLSSGHWFAKQSIYIKNNEIVGTQLWSPPNGQQFQVNNVEAFGISSETAMAALATNPNFTGIAILRSFSPDHYEGGAWNTGGSCTGKVEPARAGQLVENGFTNVMHEKQVNGFNRGNKKQTNGAKLRLMDITEVFSYRHDGHPGPFRSTDPNKITKRGPDGRPPPQDCLHWCMPGPVDTWNELVLEIIRREYEK